MRIKALPANEPARMNWFKHPGTKDAHASRDASIDKLLLSRLSKGMML